jgi:hypothetical protein
MLFTPVVFSTPLRIANAQKSRPFTLIHAHKMNAQRSARLSPLPCLSPSHREDNLPIADKPNIRGLSNNKMLPQKLICISPGGLKGFYMFGICKFIHSNYCLDRFIFSGASAGSWLSLCMSFKGDLQEIQTNVVDKSIQEAKSVWKMENLFKEQLLKQYTAEDFHLNRLHIGVTTIHQSKPHSMIFSNFDSLEDAVDCCIASSHIPFITGNLLNIYKNHITFDGGFSKYPFLKNNTTEPALFITPDMWKQNYTNNCLSLRDYTNILSKGKYNLQNLIVEGSEESIRNKKFFDSIFHE